jgi:hypothetical protein
MLGSGEGPDVPDGEGTMINSERQAPSPGTTVVLCWQSALAQEPERRTWEELEQARQLLGPALEQLEQVESQVWQVEVVVS